MMSPNVLTENGIFLLIQTLRSLNKSASKKRLRGQFDMKIETMYGNHLSPPPNCEQRTKRMGDDEFLADPMWSPTKGTTNSDPDECEYIYEDNNGPEHQMPEADDLEDLDKLIGAEVVVP